MSSLIHEAVSSGTLTSPGRLSAFLSAVLSAVRVDQNLNVTSLANELRTVPPSDVSFVTVPVSTMNYETPTGESAVLWDASAASTMFSRIKSDQPISAKTPAPKKTGTHKAKPALKPGQVPVDIWNGTLISGLSAATGRQLATAGFDVHRAGLTWTSSDIPTTIIGYPPGKIAWARLLHKALPGAELQKVPSLTRLRVILGTAGYGFSPLPAAATPSPSPAPSPGSPGSTPRTAVQAACH
jgi:hypothetical protein